jgi:hypothetical protein
LLPISKAFRNDEDRMKLFSCVFNGRSSPARISIGIAEDGETHVWLPGCRETVIIRKGYPIEIDISGNSPGPDVAILLEAHCDPTRL